MDLLFTQPPRPSQQQDIARCCTMREDKALRWLLGCRTLSYFACPKSVSLSVMFRHFKGKLRDHKRRTREENTYCKLWMGKMWVVWFTEQLSPFALIGPNARCEAMPPSSGGVSSRPVSDPSQPLAVMLAA